jgi:hypothetical protein
MKNVRRSRVTVTPGKASEWLSKNTHNRQLRETKVAKYVRDMRSGRWRYNPLLCIGIAADGTVVDGQHRLTACVQSGCSFETDVVFGASMEDQETVDIGATREAYDYLQLEEVSSAKRIAALARLLVMHLDAGIGNSGGAHDPSKTEVLEFARTHAEELQASLIGSKELRRMAIPRVLDFCNFLFRQQHKKAAVQFMKDLQTGEMLSAKNPVYHLRKRLLLNQASRTKMHHRYMVALFFKAWIYYRAGAEITRLRWRTDGSTPEPFPTI